MFCIGNVLAKFNSASWCWSFLLIDLATSTSLQYCRLKSYRVAWRWLGGCFSLTRIIIIVNYWMCAALCFLMTAHVCRNMLVGTATFWWRSYWQDEVLDGWKCTGRSKLARGTEDRNLLMKETNNTRQVSEGNLPDPPAHQHHHAFKELGPLTRSSFQYYQPQFSLFGVRFSVLLLFGIS